ELQPGSGPGGPCARGARVASGRVAQPAGGTADLALSTDVINRRQVSRLTEMISDMIPAGGAAAVLGLSYKPGTPVIEESQGVMLAKSLKDVGIDVIAHDPMASAPA